MEWVFQLCPRRDLVNGPTGEAILFVVVSAGMDFNRFSIEADSASSKTIYSLPFLTLQIFFIQHLKIQSSQTALKQKLVRCIFFFKQEFCGVITTNEIFI